MSRRSVAVIAVLACFTVAILTACGSDDSGGSSTAGNAAATNAETTAAAPAATNGTTTPSTASTATPSSTKDDATVVTLCHKAFDPFLAQLHKIEKMIDGTPRFATYRAVTKKLQTGYSKFDVGSIPSDSCLNSVSVPTTNAAFTHIAVTKTWTECRKRGNCSKAMPKIEKQWRDASELVDEADKGFEKVTAS